MIIIIEDNIKLFKIYKSLFERKTYVIVVSNAVVRVNPSRKVLTIII